MLGFFFFFWFTTSLTLEILCILTAPPSINMIVDHNEESLSRMDSYIAHLYLISFISTSNIRYAFKNFT